MENQARLDPYRFVRGLRDAALRKGVRLYEGTPVTAVEPGSPAVVTTPGGELRASRVVLALNAHSVAFPFLRPYVQAVHTYAIATEPLDEETFRRVGPVHAEEVLIFDYNPEGGGHYDQRLRNDRRLIFGGGAPVHGPGPGRLAHATGRTGFRPAAGPEPPPRCACPAGWQFAAPSDPGPRSVDPSIARSSRRPRPAASAPGCCRSWESAPGQLEPLLTILQPVTEQIRSADRKLTARAKEDEVTRRLSNPAVCCFCAGRFDEAIERLREARAAPLRAARGIPAPQ